MSTPMQPPGPLDQPTRGSTPCSAAIGGAVARTARRQRDAERVLADAALPAELKTLVRSVVRATRLKRQEQADVAAELVAHFQDGLDAGAAAAELSGTFGDVRVAAKLIRRAKIRNRSPLWHATRFAARAVGVTFCAMVVVYVVLLVRFVSGSPTISRDYLAELNAPVDRIPVEQRAWPKWREALRALPEPPVDSPADLSRSSSDSTAVPEYAAKVAGALALAREAGKLPHLGVKLSIGHGEFTLEDAPLAPSSGNELLDQSLFGMLLGPLGKMRQICHPLATEALAAARAGNGELAAQNLHTIVALASHVGELPTLITELVSLAIYAKALETIRHMLDESPAALSEAQWVTIAHRLAAFSGGTIRANLALERFAFDDIVQRLFTDDGRGDGRAVGNLRVLATTLESFRLDAVGGRSNFDLAMPVTSALMAGRAETVAKYNELMAASIEESTIPLWKKGDSRIDAILHEIQSSPLSQTRYWLIWLLMPSLQRASVQAETIVQQRDAALTAVALQIFQRRNGRYPTALSELTPGLLPTVPIDRFDGFALRYRMTDGKVLLYSVGSDGDDDGGRAPTDEAGRTAISKWLPPSQRAAQVNPPDGDWILWPPPTPVVPTAQP